MAWLFVPGLVGLVGLSLQPSERSEVIERSATSKKTSPPPLSLPRGWKKRPYAKLLSGTILNPSMATRGVAWWISLLRDSLVNRSRVQENNGAPMMSAGYGRISLESFERCGRVSFSLRMSQASFNWDCQPFSKILPRWGFMQNGVVYPRQPLAHPMNETDSFAWPTPTAHDSRPGHAERVGRFGTKHGGKNLNDEVAKFPTPRVCSGKRSSGMNRTDLYRAMEKFPTPIARDARSPKSAAYLPGHQGSQGLVQKIGGTLNPTWVEWLMGFPLGWTDLNVLVTQSSRRKPNTP